MNKEWDLYSSKEGEQEPPKHKLKQEFYLMDDDGRLTVLLAIGKIFSVLPGQKYKVTVENID